LKFIKAELTEQKNGETTYHIKKVRSAIKREYERLSMIFNVCGFDFPVQTVNISAGGMQLRSSYEVEKNKTYDLEIDYISRKLPVKYEVLRVNKERNKFLISGRFVEIDKDTKAFILQQNLKNKIFALKASPLKGGENE